MNNDQIPIDEVLKKLDKYSIRQLNKINNYFRNLTLPFLYETILIKPSDILLKKICKICKNY